MSSRPHLPPAAVDYPSSDGKPLAENDLQARAILYAFGALRVRYRERRSDVYVSADLLIYYEEATHECRSHPTCSWSSGSRTTRG